MKKTGNKHPPYHSKLTKKPTQRKTRHRRGQLQKFMYWNFWHFSLVELCHFLIFRLFSSYFSYSFIEFGQPVLLAVVIVGTSSIRFQASLQLKPAPCSHLVSESLAIVTAICYGVSLPFDKVNPSNTSTRNISFLFLEGDIFVHYLQSICQDLHSYLLESAYIYGKLTLFSN